MDTHQRKPRKGNLHDHAFLLQQESIKTRRLYGCIILGGFFVLIIVLSVIMGILLMDYDIREQFIQYIETHWGAVSLGFIVGMGIHNIPKIVRYFAHDSMLPH